VCCMFESLADYLTKDLRPPGTNNSVMRATIEQSD
jgi:hypothetical protein